MNELTGGGGTCTGSGGSGQDPRKIPNPICNSAASGLILFGTARLRRTGQSISAQPALQACNSRVTH